MKRILIVEDDQITEKILANRLTKAGYEVSAAPDALTAVRTAVRTQPDLALLDIFMPAGDGFAVADRIQELLPHEIPFIFMTASKQPDLRRKATMFGATDFFEKPYETEDLLAAIEGALGE